jgi:hypothetical protein
MWLVSFWDYPLSGVEHLTLLVGKESVAVAVNLARFRAVLASFSSAAELKHGKQIDNGIGQSHKALSTPYVLGV